MNTFKFWCANIPFTDISVTSGSVLLNQRRKAYKGFPAISPENNRFFYLNLPGEVNTIQKGKDLAFLRSSLPNR